MVNTLFHPPERPPLRHLLVILAFALGTLLIPATLLVQSALADWDGVFTFATK